MEWHLGNGFNKERRLTNGFQEAGGQRQGVLPRGGLEGTDRPGWSDQGDSRR